MPGQGIGNTVVVIHGHSVAGALTVFPVGIESDVGNAARNLRDIHAAIEQEAVQGQDSVFTGSSAKNNSGLEQVGGADLGGGDSFDQLIETAAFPFVVHDGNDPEVSTIIRQEDPIRHNR